MEDLKINEQGDICQHVVFSGSGRGVSIECADGVGESIRVDISDADAARLRDWLNQYLESAQ
jgi:type II secretory pathway component PulM